MTYDEIVQGLRDSNYELQNEGRRVAAGLKTEQDTAGIIERYAWLYAEEALDAVGEPIDEEHRRVRAALLQGIVERRAAALEDRLSTLYATALVTAGEERIPFYTAQAQLATEPAPGRRESLAAATATVMAEADDLHLEREAIVQETIRGFGMGGHTQFWSSLKQVDYEGLRDELTRVADAAAGRYRAWIEPRMEAAGAAFGDCRHAHLSFFRHVSEHDAAFTAERFEPAMRRTFERLGLPLFASPTIQLDLADRPAKNPRASVWVPEAGREVHLLVRPSGGSTDYAAFLHEAGHALHFGLTDPAIGWPLANLGRSMAYTELWSYLVEHIGHDPAWLVEATGVGDAGAERIATDLTGADLMLFMRYVGKLTVELELYAGDPLDAARGQDLYAGGLGARTGFVYDPRSWQFDRDPGYYSADYLRAWLGEQWLRGWAPEAEELIADMGGRPWSGDALLERMDRRLPGDRVTTGMA
jgi:hypothetical protein